MARTVVNTAVCTEEVPSERAGQRLDNYLATRLKGVPRSLIYRVIRTGQVRVNGRRAPVPHSASRPVTGCAFRP